MTAARRAPRARPTRPGPHARPPETRADRAGAAKAGADSPGLERAAMVLRITLIVLAAARLALAFVPNMWVWGLNLHRFLSPAAAWGPWTLAALALVPAIGRPLDRALDRLGNGLARRPVVAGLALATIAFALAWWLPDRVRYVGDFLLRQGAVEENVPPAGVFPQALPLDVLVHVTLPTAIVNAGWLRADTIARLLGAGEAALLALVAGAFARALALRGAAAAATAAIVLFGGYLGIFTGYNKAFSEMVVLAGGIGLLGVGVVRERRGWLALGAALAVALAFHRSALAFLPAVAGLWIFTLARPRTDDEHGPARWIGIALPLVTLAAVTPRILSAMRDIDVAHFAPPAAGGVSALAAAFAGARVADLFNLAVMFSPLALAIPVLLLRVARRSPRRLEIGWLLALALPWVAMAAVLHPKQGLFRDWDMIAAGGVTLSLLAAALVGETLHSARRARGLAAAVVLAVAAPAGQWLAHGSDPLRGHARVEAYLAEAPARSGLERGTSWDYLGSTAFNDERWSASTHAFARAAETAPSARILQQWALAETMAGNLRGAQALYHRLEKMTPENQSLWLGLAAVASRIPDPTDSRRAARALLRLHPGDTGALQILEYLDRDFPETPRAGGAGVPHEP